MEIIFKSAINIVFIIYGISIPIFLIFKNINSKNILKTLLISVLIFISFYIYKIGGYNMINKHELEIKKKNEKVSTKERIKEKDTEEGESKETLKEEVTTTTKKEITTTKVKEKTTTIKDDYEYNITNATYIDGVLIVNKTYALPKNFKPSNPYQKVNGQRYCSLCIDKTTYEHFQEMKADAEAIGLNIWIQSGYRSYDLQKDLYDDYVLRDGKAMADTYSARPGHSEHQTGLAFDLNTITDDFAYTDEGKWVNEVAYKYGFILRYPKGKDHITGYKYEPWHLRYVGYDLASKLYNNGDWITLEEYFNLTSVYE